jgi:hypothetical protein
MENHPKEHEASKKDKAMFTKYITCLKSGGFGYQAVVLLVLISLIMPYGWSGARATISVLYAKPVISGNGDCSSWDDACTLQTALTNAVTGDQIWVSAGRYIPSIYADRSVSFQLKEGVAVYGGFNGTETSLEQRNWITNVTTLSGDLIGNDIGFTFNNENSYHVVKGASGAILDGVTIKGGNGNGDYPDNECSGIYNKDSINLTLINLAIIDNSAIGTAGLCNYNSNPTITNVWFTNNHSDYGSGGMYDFYSSPVLNDVTFSENSGNYGGAIANYASSPELINITITDNEGANGAGVFNQYGSNPTLTNVVFEDNSGSGMFNMDSSPVLNEVIFRNNNGGGMVNSNSNPVINNVDFIGNSSGNGGGMWNWHSSPVLTSVSFIGNTANKGGGMYNVETSPILINVTFSENSSSGDGGGIYNFYNGSPTLNNVTFYHNTAVDNGGGIYNLGGTVATNLTFNLNSAKLGGGIFITGSDIPIQNSIFWGDGGGEIVLEGSSNPSITYSDIQGGFPGIGNIDSDPLLLQLGDYGGEVETQAVFPGSPVIDAASIGCPATDARGFPRSSPSCDMGAFESQGFSLTKISGDNQSILLNGHVRTSLCVQVQANNIAEPVAGGLITFSSPGSGASITMLTNPAVITNGSACSSGIANEIAGSYVVTAHGSGTDTVDFNLLNIIPFFSFMPIVRR